MTITADDITAAAARIAPHVRETPLWRMPSSAFDLPAGAPPFEVLL
jgi:threonine dehydratase